MCHVTGYLILCLRQHISAALHAADVNLSPEEEIVVVICVQLVPYRDDNKDGHQ